MRIPRSLRFVISVYLLTAAPTVRGQLFSLVEAETQPALAGDADLAADPSGAHLYAASATQAAISAFARDGGTGELTFVETETTGNNCTEGLKGVNQLALSPDGASFYAAGRGCDAIARFSRDGSTGALAFVTSYVNEQVQGPVTIEGIWQIKGLAVSAGGGYVLASGRTVPAQPKGALALFARDGAGALTFVSALADGEPSGGLTIAGLGTGGRVFLSPDGTSVYVVVPSASSIVVFSFDEGTGALAFVEQVADGVGGVDGIAGTTDLAFSSDGTHVYAAGATDNAVAVFARDSGTGELSFVEAVRGGAGIAGFAGVLGVAVSSDGQYVFSAAPGDNAVGALVRDAGSGSLAWLGAGVDGVDGLDGLAGAGAVEVEGSFVYVSGPGDTAIAVLEPGDAYDFGDAVDPTYPTLLASDGARHRVVPGFFLGSGIDAEGDGAPSAAADGDDLAGVDDEDGVVFSQPLVPGQMSEVEVTASAPGALDAWIDFGGNGDWDDAGDQIAAGAALAAGVNAIQFAVPANALPDSALIGRFRLRGAADPALTPSGAAPSGEVEDVAVQSVAGADLQVVKTTATQAIDWNEGITYQIVVTNLGPNDAVAASVEDFVSPLLVNVSWTCTPSGVATCAASGTGDIEDLVTLPAGASVTYELTGTLIDEDSGPAGPYLVNVATATVPGTVVDPVASNDSDEVSTLVVPIFRDDFETGDVSRWDASFGAP